MTTGERSFSLVVSMPRRLAAMAAAFCGAAATAADLRLPAL
jgi:hypothetical protein